MSATLGMIGINSDTLTLSNNLTVANTTQTQNLTVLGNTSFPVNSINSNAIIGGGGGLTLTDNIIDTADYILFNSQSTGAITTTNTNANLLYNASSATLSVPNITTTLLTGSTTKSQLTSDTTSSTANYLTFSANQSGSGQLKTNTNLSYIPSTGKLNCSGVYFTNLNYYPNMSSPTPITNSTNGNLTSVSLYNYYSVISLSLIHI